eukprot:CAMPEP_0204019012 /NCGR_PEP_ID=MMETSP0360-20130528/28463_1 /ASSEMBLY_ACC=CAM_ASM_000342 /TAXON_ID=268821 /ORGANISM="Scrippsiella Hangoei, Strain SHTV-5" /LENGTH=220 /DNA_ID=CAMNT_0050962201 /DNA_START=16 /DNA_END=674 /DNA_ORIENTATION=+
MAGIDGDDVYASLASLQKDVESKAATIKHLQNALNAKSMTIEILSKHNKEGGDLQNTIDTVVQTKTEAAVKSKEDEIQRLRAQLSEAGVNSTGHDSEVHRLEKELRESKRECEGNRSGFEKAIQNAVEQALESKKQERWELEEEHRRVAAALKEESRKLQAVIDEQLAVNSSKEEEDELQKKAAKAASEMRVYQQKAFELKSANDVLSSELERVQEELQT